MHKLPKSEKNLDILVSYIILYIHADLSNFVKNSLLLLLWIDLRLSFVFSKALREVTMILNAFIQSGPRLISRSDEKTNKWVSLILSKRQCTSQWTRMLPQVVFASGKVATTHLYVRCFCAYTYAHIRILCRSCGWLSNALWSE